LDLRQGRRVEELHSHPGGRNLGVGEPAGSATWSGR